MSVVALVRFSFADTRADSRARRALMSAERLDHRLRLFETICLPSLAAQPADTFRALVLCASELPNPYRERLEALLDGHPNLHALFEPPMSIGDAFALGLERHAPSGPLVATCRLDDDDALAVGFTRTLTRYVVPEHVGHCVSLAKGLWAQRYADRCFFLERTVPAVAAGLAFVSNARDVTNVFQCGNHSTIGDRHPLHVDDDTCQYLVTNHRYNASGRRFEGKRRRVRNFLRRRPPDVPRRAISVDTFRRLHREAFPFLAGCDWSVL